MRSRARSSILDPGVVEGKPLEEISSRNLHVAKLLAATSENGAAAGNDSTEFKLFLRGRDHSYISRNLPWMGSNGERLGTIVLLQDVTYVRDQERSRTNLIATLSHELKTPLTSLTIGADLLTESIPPEVASRQREILDTIHQDVSRLNAIATDSSMRRGKVRRASESSAAPSCSTKLCARRVARWRFRPAKNRSASK